MYVYQLLEQINATYNYLASECEQFNISRVFHVYLESRTTLQCDSAYDSAYDSAGHNKKSYFRRPSGLALLANYGPHLS